MKLIKFIYPFFTLFLFCSNLNAQLNITDAATPPFNPQNLVSNIFLGSGVEVLSTQYDGNDAAVGFFSGGLDDIGLERGIIMSTARVKGVASPNNGTDDVGADDATNGGTIDENLEEIATDALRDVSRYTIRFIPAADTLRFRYVFASEEYPEFVCSGFNDVFGFFISGMNPDGGDYNARNIALVPDPSDPTGLTFTDTPVAIDNVHDGSAGACSASFEDFYKINPAGNPNFKLDAYTSVFTAEAIVVPCEEYVISLAIADVGDDNFGSSVFLEAKSFGTGTLEVELNSLSVDGSLAEGCGTGELEFNLPENVDRDYVIDIEFFNPVNAATPGVDYPEIPSQLIIPAGSNSVSVPLEAFQDGESEMDEVIAFEIQVDVCNRKRFEILIRDDDLFAPILPSDTTICSGEDYLIESMLDPAFILPDDPYFENTTEVAISPEKEAIYSDIIVAGVIPTVMQPNIIERVCIQGLEHRILNDFEIYLLSPGGQILELSTNNGFKPNNVADVDRYENTCFTPFASTNINNGSNIVGPIFEGNPTYTGDFAPEGVWSDLWDGEKPTNGTWRLLVLDNQVGFEGTLEGWSITFRSFYGLTYEWSSDPVSTLCENCEDINVNPSSETEYTLKVIDSYGCDRSASTIVKVDPSLDMPVITCGQVTENSIEVLWNNVADNQGYEIRLDGGTWINVSSENYTFFPISSSTDFAIEVRAIGPQCSSQPTLLNCRTLDCAQPVVAASIDSEVSCSGGDDGTVSISATGIGPFTYEINGLTNTTGVFDNVRAGLTEYTVSDATGCSALGDFIMPGPDPFSMTPEYNLSDPCNVISNISGSFVISGGMPPYNYAWSTGSTQQVASNLTQGSFQLTLTDANGCDTVAELVVPNLEQLSWDVATTAPLCKDEANGVAIVEIISGNGPFTYLWEDGTSEVSNPNLEEGNYLVTVTDVLGCADTKLFTVTEGAILSIDIFLEDASCLGQQDGSATATVTGGLGPYSFFWNGGTSNGSATEGLGAGTYTLFVSDENSCMLAQDFVIEEPAGMTYNAAPVNNLCFDDASGEILVNDVISPNGTVDISWDDGDTGFIRSNLSNGTYCFTLDDGTSCTLSDCIEVTSPDEIQVSEVIQGLRCIDSQDGSISLDLVGGVSPYAYQWSGPAEAGIIPPNANLTNLFAGEYSVIISDANNCTKELLYTVGEATPIQVDSSVFPISCNGEASGQIFFSATGGAPPFSYEWTGPSGFTASTNNIQEVLAGQYTVSFSDSKGCSDSYTFIITQPEQPLLANITSENSVCFGLVDGTLEVSPSGGSTPYSVEWSDGSTGLEATNLGPGIYEVTITDGRNCTTVEMTEIREVEKINLSLDQSPSKCFQTEDGAAAITGISYGNIGADVGNFSVEWSTSPPQNTLIASGLTGGQTYSVLVTDAQGCTGEESIVVETPDAVDASSIKVDNVKCFGGKDGRLEITGTGGTGSYTYLWDSGAGASTSSVADKLARGTYTVTVTDENGCTGSSTFIIDEPRPLDLDFRKIEVSCYEGSDGRAEVVVTGGTFPYTYLWSNEGENAAIELLATDWYEVTVTDDNGCTLTDSTLIFQPDEAISASFDIEEVSCYGGRDGRIEVEASGGSGFYRYSIDGNSYSSTSVFPSLIGGDYSVFVKDFKGCTQEFSDILVLEPDEISVDLGPDLIISFGDRIKIPSVITNAQGYISYEWRSANLEFLTCDSCPNPTFEGDREASYELVITDENGCTGSDFISVRLENFSPLYVPTAFTPNGDGENDLLELFGKGIASIQRFAIYDRWGELVYDLTDVDIDNIYESWDGEFKGKEAPSGIYYWFAEVLFENGFEEEFNGNTSLLR